MALFSCHAFAQTINIHFKNGTKVEFHNDLVDHVDFSEKPSDPTLTAGEAVDLGLSVMWASCNLGATSPTEAGDKYAWGETQAKTKGTQSNYAYYNSSTLSYTDIGADISGTSYDAATVNLGGGWKMPTEDQLYELYRKCSWEWTQIGGVNGYKVTGPNGNNIFFASDADNHPGFWTSNPSSSNKERAIFGHFYPSSYIYMSGSYSSAKYDINYIRPVISYDDYNGTTDYDDSAVTSKVSSYYAGQGGLVMANGTTVLSGSKLNFCFSNGSAEDVILTGIQMVNGITKVAGNNLLSSDVTVPAGEEVAYTITIGISGLDSPICRFTYRYNNHTYTTEAAYQSLSLVKGKTIELFDE